MARAEHRQASNLLSHYHGIASTIRLEATGGSQDQPMTMDDARPQWARMLSVTL
jgi:hypothetical protein